MACRITDLVLNCVDPGALAPFWCAVLGYTELERDETGVSLGPPGGGARPVDIGQGDVSWHVLADPEGHEFCLLRSTVAPG